LQVFGEIMDLKIISYITITAYFNSISENKLINSIILRDKITCQLKL
jgi:hypothetical protein